MPNLTELELSILNLRGQRVLLSSDLARLYGVTPGVLIQAVKRNIARFPADFMFHLSTEEWKNLKSQNVISNWGGARTAPYAFTEQGVGMLSSVLKSQQAVQANIEIMRAFVRLRRILAEHRDLAQRLDELEQRYDKQFGAVFNAIRQLMTPPQQTKRSIGFTADLEGKKVK
jgi:tetrahydromethanopterin S-methyltransferase subunit G